MSVLAIALLIVALCQHVVSDSVNAALRADIGKLDALRAQFEREQADIRDNRRVYDLDYALYLSVSHALISAVIYLQLS
ncbi:hypothetical protein SeLEV6574_g06343 [Synchytrium endobioticum]|uniref:GOLD domain-containing protein n=1 Tax=Synchytrium endobioticum TaxID=286115 RepID=A0A507CP89_9FUNG|nr:hypothetical protein SeLEV6574_g06343 [Synchytrium endobioticum]